MKRTWETEGAIFRKQIDLLPGEILAAAKFLNEIQIEVPLPHPLDSRANRMVQLYLYCIGCVRISSELIIAAKEALHRGHLISVSLNLRLLMEMWGAISFATSLCNRADKLTESSPSDEVDRIGASVDRLVLGSRYPVELPWGGKSDETSYNTMKFIQHLDDQVRGAKIMYDFLCEICHPSYIQQSYMWLAGSVGSNWGNDKFKQHADQLLKETLTIATTAAHGIRENSKTISRNIKPIADAIKSD